MQAINQVWKNVDRPEYDSYSLEQSPQAQGKAEALFIHIWHET